MVKLGLWGVVLWLLGTLPLWSAEQIRIKMRGQQYTISVAEIEHFWQTGETEQELPEVLKQNPFLRLMLLQVLRQELPVPTVTPAQGQEVWLGIAQEILWQQLVQIIRPASGGGSAEMLRTTFNASVRNGKINPLRFIRNFPDREIIIDGDQLADLQKSLATDAK
ncbi:MAG: alpha/beta hydrolase [Pseudanabaenaceae cyanobacterium]